MKIIGELNKLESVVKIAMRGKEIIWNQKIESVNAYEFCLIINNKNEFVILDNLS